MRCSQCYAENTPLARYCSACGTALGERCAGCDYLNPKNFKYCGQCGTSLTSARIERPQAQVAIEGTPEESTDPERRQLTIMFCDLVGSTALSVQLEAEDLRDLILEYRQLCVAEIERMDGFVARYVGDSLLVYFGYPRAHDDDAVRAVAAAMAIVSRIAASSDSVQARFDSRIEVHIGVHTGEVIAGELGSGIAREESAIIGEAPNIAARLQQAAPAGAVLISDMTRRLVSHAFETESAGDLDVKGLTRALPTYRICGPRSSASTGTLEAQSRTPLLGRAEELAFLCKQWTIVEEGRGRVQLVSGEPGIGKSRLLRALSDHVSARGYTPLVAQCVAHFSNTALHPFVQLLGVELDFTRDDSPAARMTKLDNAFHSGRLQEREALPLLASLMSLPVPADAAPGESSHRRQREKLLECLLRWLLARAERRPVILIIEDIHWADASTLELLTLLLDQVATVPIFLVLTLRPEFTAPWSARTVVSQLTLTRLSAAHSKEMIGYLAQGQTFSPALLEQVVNRTDGVPLFIEELTKMVLEAAASEQERAVNALPPGAIPATLRGSLVARLDRLEKAKSVAQLGAVIGRDFSFKLIHAVAQQDERELRKALARLIDAELLYQRGFPPDEVYTFKHALIQDAAYQSLLKTKRAEYHRATARALVTQFQDVADRHPELVAQHYSEGGLGDEAGAFWEKAGARALEASADHEAIAHLRRALSQIATMPASSDRAAREIACLLSLGAALTAVRGYASSEVEQTYQRAVALCEQSGDAERLFTALTGLNSFYQVRGPLVTSRRISERLLELAQDRSDNTWLAQAHRRLGWCLFCQGQLDSGRAHLESALRLYDRLRSHEHTRIFGAHPWVVGCVNLALLEWFAGHPDAAVVRSNDALTHARELGRPLTLAYALCMSAAVYQCRGDVRQTLALAQEVVALAKEHDFPYWVAWGSVLEGWALASAGSLQDGIGKMKQGLATYRETGALLFEPWSLALLAETYAQAAQFDEAMACLSLAMESPELENDYFYSADIHRIWGELSLTRDGDAERAETHLLKALAIAREQRAKSLELRCAAALANLRVHQGRAGEGRALVREIVAQIGEGFDTTDVRSALALSGDS